MQEKKYNSNLFVLKKLVETNKIIMNHSASSGAFKQTTIFNHQLFFRRYREWCLEEARYSQESSIPRQEHTGPYLQ